MADNQVLVANTAFGGLVTVETAPFDLRECEDRLAVSLTVHFLFGPNTPTARYATEVSLDGGARWVLAADGPEDSTTAVGTRQRVGAVYGRLARLRVEFDIQGGTPGVGAVGYRITVQIDKA